MIEHRNDLVPFINAAIAGLSFGAGSWVWKRMANAGRLSQVAASVGAIIVVAIILINAKGLTLGWLMPD